MTGRTRSGIIAAGCAFLLSAGAAHGQARGAVSGRVVDSDGRPVESVEISATTVGRFARTDSAGRFFIAGLLVGRNRMLARRLGWKAVDTSIVADANTPASLTIVMRRVAQDLASVHIVSQDECPTRTLEGFDCRRRAGLGAFRDSTEIAALKPFCQEHIIDGMAGLRLVPHLGCPSYEATTGWRCLKILVDGLPNQGAPRLMKDYVGVEFYADYAKAPDWYKQYAFDQSTQGVPTRQLGPGQDIIYRQSSLPGRNCSLIVYWTHFAPKSDASLDQSRLTTQVMKARRDSILKSMRELLPVKADPDSRRKP
jgi:hypothetical protein